MKPMLLNHLPAKGRRAFTIVEVIMVFIIIGVLTLILVPVVTNRAEDAKVAAATSDLERIADAQERAGVDTGYYYRLYALNDTGDPALADGNANARANLTISPTGRNGQSLFDNQVSTNNYYENPEKIFIRTSGAAAGRGNYIGGSLTSLYQNAYVNETGFNWNGPYVNWQTDKNDNDWPEDPWGRDYLLFTRAGVIFPPDRISETQVQRPDPSAIFQTTISGRYAYTQDNLDELFDRPTLLSLGPNGEPGDGSNPAIQVNGVFSGRFGRGDDIVRQFGSP